MSEVTDGRAARRVRRMARESYRRGWRDGLRTGVAVGLAVSLLVLWAAWFRYSEARASRAALTGREVPHAVASNEWGGGPAAHHKLYTNCQIHT